MMASAASSAAVTGEPSALLRTPACCGEIQDGLRRVRGDPGQRVHQIGACGGIEGWHGRFLAISAG